MKKGFVLSISAVCLILGVGLSSCYDYSRSAPEAYRDWAALCPGHPEEDADGPTLWAAQRGDPAALDCMVAKYAYLEQPFGEDGEPSSVFRMQRLQTLYVRWRLTGERLDEALALAALMDAERVERATYAFSYVEAGVDLPHPNACGFVDRNDPAFTLVSHARDFHAYWLEDCPETAP